jgi:hypothetical protein
MLRRSMLSNSTTSISRATIKRVGPKQKAWRSYREKRANSDLDEDELIKCQDHLIGLPACGIARPPSEMDLHHIKGRNERPDLYFEDSNNIWLTRECHDEAHN